MRLKALSALLFLALPLAGFGQTTDDDQVSADSLFYAHTMSGNTGRSDAAGLGALGTRTGGGVLGIDSIPNWSGSFYDPGADSFGNLQFAWQYTMVGNSPFARHGEDGEDSHGATTVIGAPVIPVNLDLRNFDGSPRFVNGHRLISDATQFLTPTLNSPVFAKALYDSSEDPTQFTDAVQRAEFHEKVSEEWHTLLAPRAGTSRTMVLIRGTYRFALHSDGTCCAEVLIDANVFNNALFPATAGDTTTVMGAAENSGEIKTTDISTFLFPNAFLYLGGNPSDCCVLGFHAYDVEPGGPQNGNREKRYVMNYSSWVSPGLFGDPTLLDITPLSHEMTETFNDPFPNSVGNATPWWLAPNGNCQNNLETGDVIEGLPNAHYPIKVNGVTYHPQNEALLQWFAGVTPSSAIHKAYSYPDTTILTAAAVSMTPGCKAPLP